MSDNSAFNPASNPAFNGSQPHGQPIQPIAVAPVMMVQQPKSMAVAYLLWFFLGSPGIHKFYLNQTGQGILYLCLFLTGWATVWFLIGIIPLVILGILLIIDIFLIPGRVNQLNGVTPRCREAVTTHYHDPTAHWRIPHPHSRGCGIFV